MFRLSPTPVVVGFLHFHHKKSTAKSEPVDRQTQSALLLAGASFTGVAALGGIYRMAHKNKKRDEMTIVFLSRQGATSTTWATRVHDGRICVTSQGQCFETLPSKPTAEVLMDRVRRATEADKQGCLRNKKKFVAVSSDLMASANHGELVKLAGVVERELPGSAELHGLATAHESSYLLSAVRTLEAAAQPVKANADNAGNAFPLAADFGVVSTVGSGKDLFITGARKAAENSLGETDNDDGDSDPSLSLIPCDIPGKGVELLTKQGGAMGASMFEWHVKRVAANSTRTRSGGACLSGKYALVGREPFVLLRSSVGNTKTGVRESSSHVLSKEVVLQRLDGEVAALQQWLKLFEEAGSADDTEVEKGEGCRELTPASMAEKRSLLAHAIALRTVVDLAFDNTATFFVPPLDKGVADLSGKTRSGSSLDSAQLVSLGVYTEKRLEA